MIRFTCPGILALAFISGGLITVVVMSIGCPLPAKRHACDVATIKRNL